MEDDNQSIVSEMTHGTVNTTMSAKDELTMYVKQWIKAEQELRQAKLVVQTLKSKKQTITQSLMGVMKQHNIDCLDIHGGSLLYKRQTTKKPISGKYLFEQLSFWGEFRKQLALQGVCFSHKH